MNNTISTSTSTTNLNIIKNLKNLVVGSFNLPIILFNNNNIRIFINRFCCMHFKYFSVWKRLSRLVRYSEGLSIFIEPNDHKQVIHILKAILNDQYFLLQKDNCDENDIDIIVRIIIDYNDYPLANYQQLCEDFLSSKTFVDRLSSQQKELLFKLFLPDFTGLHRKYHQTFLFTITKFVSYLAVSEQADFINRAFYLSVVACKDDNRLQVTWFINVFFCLEDFYRYLGVREMYLFIITIAVCFPNFNKNLNKLMPSYAFEQFLIKLGLQSSEYKCLDNKHSHDEVKVNGVHDERLLMLQNGKIRFIEDLFNMVSQNVQNGAEYDVSYYDVSHIDALDNCNCNFIPVRISVETFDKIMDSFATVQYNC